MRRYAVIIPLVLFACSSRESTPDTGQPQTVCTREARSALAVTLLDAVTGARVTGATVRAVDGEHAENLVEYEGVYSGAHERSGTYTIVVSHPDYEQWQRAGVVVREDECHVITERIEARLARRP